jgi:PAS domain S-box-containing protein
VSAEPERKWTRNLLGSFMDKRQGVSVARSLKYLFIGVFLASVLILLLVEFVFLSAGYISLSHFAIEVGLLTVIEAAVVLTACLIVRRAVVYPLAAEENTRTGTASIIDAIINPKLAKLAKRVAKPPRESEEESEEHYRRLFENATDCIYSISTDGRLSYLNPAFEKLTGWSREEWLEKNLAELVHHEDLAKAVEIFQKTSSGQMPPIYKLRIRTKSGEYRGREFVSTTLVEGGEVVGELGIARDVTEWWQTSEAFEKLEGLNKLLVDSIKKGMHPRSESGTLTEKRP